MKEFERIINQAIASAENVECDEDAFKMGLAVMWHTLNGRVGLEDIDLQSSEVLGVVDAQG